MSLKSKIIDYRLLSPNDRPMPQSQHKTYMMDCEQWNSITGIGQHLSLFIYLRGLDLKIMLFCA
jgi:hypothetical protein